ncbi:hypothetical protein QBC41DRAFT_41960 [Cercophora samala]|uniref:Uncharacterized protein n=1 Tax=Cercophora samala TaxID=330535 RepID=A0AA39YX50_9PEZI|nr:hypothetical protein QBC41DRAFT_41960 [Cercophora samala]
MVMDAGDERVDRAKIQLRTWCKGMVEVTIVHPSGSARRTWNIGLGEAMVQDVLLKSGVTKDTVLDAISQILLAEFCHRGPFSHISHLGWTKQLLFLRNKHSLDNPPFVFLERLQYIMTRRQVVIKLNSS